MRTERWKAEQKARLNLLKAKNCAHATLSSLEDAFGWRDPVLLRAATNFEGGVVGCGETCGVVTGGILGIGALLSARRPEPGATLEDAIHNLSREYRQWFESRFGTSACRQRTGVDFWTARGLARYLLPGDKLIKCLGHMGESVGYLARRMRSELPADGRGPGTAAAPGAGPAEPHCCHTVLRRLRPDDLTSGSALGWATAGLGGGVALGGSVCGALLAGILAVGLRFGYDPRSLGFAELTAAFIRGHRNLVRPPLGTPPGEVFARSRRLAAGFRRRFGGLSCLSITGRTFATREALAAFLKDPESKDCRDVMAWCEGEARSLIGT
ncbi:MAG: C-GCAxxG-C-C family (seleno)protein [bacterium]